MYDQNFYGGGPGVVDGVGGNNERRLKWGRDGVINESQLKLLKGPLPRPPENFSHTLPISHKKIGKFSNFFGP